MLLQKLFAAAIAGASDHDKVKSNAVRALGMLVRFARSQALGKVTRVHLMPLISGKLSVFLPYFLQGGEV